MFMKLNHHVLVIYDFIGISSTCSYIYYGVVFDFSVLFSASSTFDLPYQHTCTYGTNIATVNSEMAATVYTSSCHPNLNQQLTRFATLSSIRSYFNKQMKLSSTIHI